MHPRTMMRGEGKVAVAPMHMAVSMVTVGYELRLAVWEIAGITLM